MSTERWLSLWGIGGSMLSMLLCAGLGSAAIVVRDASAERLRSEVGDKVDAELLVQMQVLIDVTVDGFRISLRVLLACTFLAWVL